MKEVFIVLAGGKGQRLWPLTEKTPKYLLKIVDNRTLFEHSLKRTFNYPKIIVTEDRFIKIIRKISKKYEVPSKNVISEPLSKNTLPATLLGIFHTQKIFNVNDFCCCVLPSDHFITPAQVFISQIKEIFSLCRKNANSIFLLGIKPSSRESSFGYVQKGKILFKTNYRFFSVEKFIEKPSQTYLKKLSLRNIFWNSGIFVFRSQLFLDIVDKILNKFATNFKKSFLKNRISNFYKKIPPLQIDKSVIEKYKNLIISPAEFEWSDLGNFLAVDKMLSKNEKGNFLKGKVIELDTFNTTVISYTNNLISLFGIRNKIIVNFKNKILIISKDKAPYLKQLVEKIESSKF